MYEVYKNLPLTPLTVIKDHLISSKLGGENCIVIRALFQYKDGLLKYSDSHNKDKMVMRPSDL